MDVVRVRQATIVDVEAVASVLAEAATRLECHGVPLWRAGELTCAVIASDIAAGTFFIATMHNEVAGTVEFQLEESSRGLMPRRVKRLTCIALRSAARTPAA